MSDYIREGEEVWLIGSGEMARAYSRVLERLGIPFQAIGRSVESAEAYRAATGKTAHSGGLERWLAQGPRPPAAAIAAVSLDQLAAVGEQLIAYGVKRILVEKPAAVSLRQLRHLRSAAERCRASVYVAYNRRFYASTLQALDRIREDGGVRSFQFEFTEWGHVVDKLGLPMAISSRWFLFNSTHVVDLAFHLGGEPADLSVYTAGRTEWHPSAAIFAGAGRTRNGALFTYSANWNAPGRWGVEVLTDRHRFIFRPLEKLQVQRLGSVAIEEVPLQDEADTEFKPGLLRQTEAFLFGVHQESLMSVADCEERFSSVFYKINPRLAEMEEPL